MIYILAISSGLLAFAVISIVIRMILRPNEFLILWAIAITLIPGLLWLLDAHTMTTLAAAIIGFVLPPLLIRNRKKKD